MKNIKKFIANRFQGFAFFYGFLRHRVLIALILSITVGILDGFGLTMFLPLLQMVSGADGVDGESLGKLKFLVDGLQSMGINLTLASTLLIMVTFFLIKGFVVYISAIYEVVLAQLFIKKLRKDLLASFNRIKFKYFVMSDIGRIQNTMTGEVDRVARSFREYFKTAEQMILVFVYTLFAFFLDPQFALLVTIGGALSNLLYRKVYAKTKKKSREFTDDSHSYQGQIIQHVANFKYLRATALVDSFSDHLSKSIDDIELSRRKIGGYAAILRAGREPMLVIIVAGVILLQVMVLNGSLGAILLSLLFFYRALNALIQLQTYWNRYLEVSGSVDNIKEFQHSLKKNEESLGKEKFKKFKDRISLKEANFFYGKTRILKDIHLDIYKNETIAFVGESGSGKTTLVNILAGLMPLDAGQMIIDGRDAKELNITSYQKRIGYITQDPVIFNDSIFNNVTFWDPLNEENIIKFERAMERASILHFVENLPDGHSTLLGNNGINLSGGQRQRISIARELYKDIDILIMDEATSALDSETEQSIQNNIDDLKGSFTILIVAHRLSTIRNSDRIVVMKEGQIESIGKYEDLINENKSFERMVRLQEL